MASRYRRNTLAVAAGCLVVFIVLAVIVRSTDGPLEGELRVSRFVVDHPFLSSGFWQHVIDLAGALPLVCAIAMLVVVAMLLRDGFMAIVASVGPVLAIGLSEGVGKPLVARSEGPFYGFPSGHSTSVAAVACVAALLIQRHSSRVGFAVGAPLLALVPTAMTVALIRHRHHFLLDMIAGIALGVGTVCGLAGLLSLTLRRARSVFTASPLNE
jgi:membrane-associated phospholipid phosphatase